MFLPEVPDTCWVECQVFSRASPPPIQGSSPEKVSTPVFVNQAAKGSVIAQQKTRVQMLGSAGAKALNEILVFQTEPEI